MIYSLFWVMQDLDHQPYKNPQKGKGSQKEAPRDSLVLAEPDQGFFSGFFRSGFRVFGFLGLGFRV